MSDSVVLGFAGKKRSGKDTAAGFARVYLETQGYVVHTLAFADELREAALDLDPWVVNETCGVFSRLSHVIRRYGWEGVKDSQYGDGVREVLQRLGTEVIRVRQKSFWVDVLMDKIRKILTDAAHNDIDVAVLVTDVRFINEAEAIDVLGGTIIGLDRVTALEDGHISEEPLPESMSYTMKVIDNNGSLSNLQRKVESQVREEMSLR